MALSAAEMQVLIDKLVVNLGRWNSITNGNDTLDVTVDGGVLVPSISKLFKVLIDTFPAKGYALAADLPAVADDHSVAVVLQDPDPNNNVFWVRLGGVWTPAGANSVDALGQALTAIEQTLAQSLMPADQLVMAWVDGEGKILGGFNSTGELEATLAGGQRSNAALTGYNWAVLDANGAVMLAIREDGSLYFAGQLLEGSAYVSAGRAYHVDQGGRVVAVTPIGVTALDAKVVRTGLVQTVVDKPSIGSHSVRLYSAAGKNLFAYPGRVLPIFHGEGQSLMAGSWGFTGLKQVTGKYAYALKMPASRKYPSDVRFGLHAGTSLSTGTLAAGDVSGFAPFEAKISSHGYGGQTPMDGFAQRMHDVIAAEFDLPAQAVICTAARGGAAYVNPPADASDGLGPGTTPWANTELGLRALVQFAKSRGLEPIFPMILMQHGQSDVSGAGYDAELDEWHTLRTNFIMGLTGQQYRPKFAMTQVSSFIDAFANDGAHIDQRAWVNANRAKGAIAAPEYVFLWQYAGAFYDSADDFVHSAAPGYWKMGEYYWKVFRTEVLEEGDWRPVDVAEIAYTEGTTLLSVRFDAPVGPLVLDDTVITQPAGTCYGFTVEVTGGPTVVPTAAVVRDGVWVDFTLPAPLTPAVDRYLRTGLNGQTNPRTHEAQPRVCLRDSDPELSAYDNTPLYNWCIHSREVF